MLLTLAATTAGQEPAAAVSQAGSLHTPVVIEPLEGPLRFTERTWLRALHENPQQAEDLAARVFVTSGGRFYVPVASDRRRILEARNDASLAARLARANAERNAVRMRNALDRMPAASDLYIAHVFGPETAVRLVKVVGKAPDMALKKAFPGLSASLPELGRGAAGPITVGQFYRLLSGALREPPRLVAIGLKPTVEDPPRRDSIAEQLEREDVAWQTEVNLARAERSSAQ